MNEVNITIDPMWIALYLTLPMLAGYLLGCARLRLHDRATEIIEELKHD